MKASPELLSLLARKPAPNAAILDGYATGAIATHAATPRASHALLLSPTSRTIHRFKPRQRPRSPDREASRARRRKLADRVRCRQIFGITTRKDSARCCAPSAAK